MPELEQRGIRDYVLSQARKWSPDDSVSVVQKVGRRRVGGITYDLYDVRMSSGKHWWVITNYTNLYAQEDFQSVDEAFTYHLGAMQVIREQFKTEPDEIHTEYVGRPWRRFKRAVDAMEDAEEAEDYQAVGMRCREALVSLGTEHQDAEWVRLPVEHPMASDAKQWLRIYVDSLTTGRPRDYLRSLAQRTWEIANWLTHYTEATEWDAQLVLDATAQLLNTFALVRLRYEQGSAQRCPNCDSYQLMEDSDQDFTMADGKVGIYHWNVCFSCGWQSEKWSDNWTAEQLRRMAAYADGSWSPPKRTMEELDPDEDNPAT